jgi:hypothetical protein
MRECWLFDLINDAACEIYNLAAARADLPSFERFAIIVRVLNKLVAIVLEEQREQMLRQSNN